MKKIKLLLTIATGISTPLIIVSCKEKSNTDSTKNNQTISNEQKEIFIKQIDDLEHKLRENEAILKKTENNLISSSNQIFNIIKESKNTIIILKEMLNDSKTEHLVFNDKLTNFKSTLLNLFGSINLYTSYLEKYKLNKENFDVIVSFINTKPHLIDNQIIKDFIKKYNEFKSLMNSWNLSSKLNSTYFEGLLELYSKAKAEYDKPINNSDLEKNKSSILKLIEDKVNEINSFLNELLDSKYLSIKNALSEKTNEWNNIRDNIDNISIEELSNLFNELSSMLNNSKINKNKIDEINNKLSHLISLINEHKEVVKSNNQEKYQTINNQFMTFLNNLEENLDSLDNLEKISNKQNELISKFNEYKETKSDIDSNVRNSKINLRNKINEITEFINTHLSSQIHTDLKTKLNEGKDKAKSILDNSNSSEEQEVDSLNKLNTLFNKVKDEKELLDSKNTLETKISEAESLVNLSRDDKSSNKGNYETEFLDLESKINEAKTSVENNTKEENEVHIEKITVAFNTLKTKHDEWISSKQIINRNYENIWTELGFTKEEIDISQLKEYVENSKAKFNNIKESINLNSTENDPKNKNNFIPWEVKNNDSILDSSNVKTSNDLYMNLLSELNTYDQTAYNDIITKLSNITGLRNVLGKIFGYDTFSTFKTSDNKEYVIGIDHLNESSFNNGYHPYKENGSGLHLRKLEDYFVFALPENQLTNKGDDINFVNSFIDTLSNSLTHNERIENKKQEVLNRVKGFIDSLIKDKENKNIEELANLFIEYYNSYLNLAIIKKELNTLSAQTGKIPKKDNTRSEISYQDFISRIDSYNRINTEQEPNEQEN
ncbi:hypothetical protein [Mycoplasmopsis felis]|uniref:coiled-coil domain-containing protein n=2 Tax=Mycoplasmopsis felis TaxID=33923 RepID=UPI002AFE6163|nr:hypothetical protein [Mycoplasmopsis felis]WQQ09976.1 hypothetical protein RRG49_03270 [Mycoplasmopsis felis]